MSKSKSLSRIHQIKKGYAFVIHNESFESKDLTKRKGSEKDLDAIRSFCQKAGFKLDIIENVKVNEIRVHCRKIAREKSEFQNYDGFICFILSHGNR